MSVAAHWGSVPHARAAWSGDAAATMRMILASEYRACPARASVARASTSRSSAATPPGSASIPSRARDARLLHPGHGCRRRWGNYASTTCRWAKPPLTCCSGLTYGLRRTRAGPGLTASRASVSTAPGPTCPRAPGSMRARSHAVPRGIRIAGPRCAARRAVERRPRPSCGLSPRARLDKGLPPG